MSRIQVATRGLEDWKSRLADPEKHWKRTRSAFEAAVSWELAAKGKSGLPAEVERAVAGNPVLANPALLVALVEHKVDLPHGRRPSQNDVWALVQTDGGALSMAVEAKAGEPFDSTVGEWLAKKEAGSRKEGRLRFLTDTLGLTGDVADLRYQLLHRAVSAVIEARRWSAGNAAMLVQSFKNSKLEKQQALQWEDFRQFCKRLDARAEKGQLVQAGRPGGVRMYLGWVDSEPATDDQIRLLNDKLGLESITVPR